jgi:PAS domain S-box-containing protein
VARRSVPIDNPIPNAQLARLTGGLLFGSGVVGALTSAIAFAVLRLDLPQQRQHLLVGGCLVLAALFAGCWRLSRKASVRTNALLVCTLGVATAGLIAAASGQGIHATGLGLFGVVVCLASVTIGLRAALGYAGLCAAIVVGLAVTALSQPQTRADPAARDLVLLSGVVLCLLLAAALAVGTVISRTTLRYLNAANEREERFRSLLRLTADWYWEMDAQLRFTHLSEVAIGSAVAARVHLGRTPWEIENFGLTAETMDAHRADLEARRPFHGLVVERRNADGQLLLAHVSGEPRFDARGAFIGYWGVGRDATKEVQAQMARSASETRYRELFSRTPSPLVLHRHGLIVDANPAALLAFGVATLDDLMGRELTSFYEADGADRLRQRIAQLEQMAIGEGLPPADFKLRAADGRHLTVRALGVRVDTPDGPAVLSIYFDETERLLADAALRRSEGLLSHLVATSPNAITLSELDSGRYVMVNDSFSRITGYAKEDLIGHTSVEAGVWASSQARQQFTEQVRQQGYVYDRPQFLVTKSGEQVLMAVSAGRFEMDGREYLVVDARDVTQSERMRAEHHAILQNASIGIAFTRGRNFVQANPRFESMFGWDSGALVGQPGSAVWPSEQDYRDITRTAGPLLSEGQALDVERQLRRRDGSLIWCRVRAQAIDPDGPSAGGTIWIMEDVTERRRIDEALAAARDAAEAASRAKSAFLANTSHEIRTPLNGLLGLAQLAQEPGLPDDRRMQYLQQILDCAQSLGGIMSDILDLSKIEAGKLTPETLPFNLRTVLTAVERAYQGLAEARGLALSMHIDAGVADVVEGDPVRLRQILTNYVTNALKFTAQGQVRIDVNVAANGHVRLAVTDTGPGIERDTLSRLFRPFTQADQSTTRRYGGTGLGLSICRELATLMGGEVGADSQLGAGSTFWAELPLPAAAIPTTPLSELAAQDPLRGARVLLVEDNPVNMMIAAAMLEQWGVQVTQTVDGRAALDAVGQATADDVPFDAVLMDLQMPTMSGHEATRALRIQYSPDALPVIALTAAALLSERDEALAAGMNDFLTKPIDAARLRDVLAQWVVRRRAG